MSEYQHVVFRAIDAPVSAKNLEYMHQQSSRAEITPWSFDNEYHYSSFRGNAVEMLRRGYDLHLDYSNYGGCKLMIRLPLGLPDPLAAKAYFDKEGMKFVKDPKGPGGILCLEPFFESFDSGIDPDEILDELSPLRAEILSGDLRPLYLGHLISACDDNHDPEEELEGPVPAGLGQPSQAQVALMELYGLSEDMVKAAARDCPPLPSRQNREAGYAEWIARQSESIKNAWLVDILSNPDSTAKREIMAEYQAENRPSAWPTTRRDRSIAVLLAAEDEIANAAKSKAAAKEEKARKKKLASIAANPESTIQETERLAKARGAESYRAIAELLVELRDALAGSDKSDLAEQQARHLKSKNPTLKSLHRELQRVGFIKK